MIWWLAIATAGASPASPVDLTGRANNLCYRDGSADYVGADKLYREAERLDPGNSYVLVSQATCYVRRARDLIFVVPGPEKDRLEKAERWLARAWGLSGRALAVAPESSGAHFVRVEVMALRKQYTEAMAMLERMQSEQTVSAEQAAALHAWMAYVAKQLGHSPAEHAERARDAIAPFAFTEYASELEQIEPDDSVFAGLPIVAPWTPYRPPVAATPPPAQGQTPPQGQPPAQGQPAQGQPPPQGQTAQGQAPAHQPPGAQATPRPTPTPRQPRVRRKAKTPLDTVVDVGNHTGVRFEREGDIDYGVRLGLFGMSLHGQRVWIGSVAVSAYGELALPDMEDHQLHLGLGPGTDLVSTFVQVTLAYQWDPAGEDYQVQVGFDKALGSSDLGHSWITPQIMGGWSF